MQPESLVGANIVMERSLPEFGNARRRLFVTKVRGSKFREGYNDYDITEGGVVSPSGLEKLRARVSGP